MELRCHQKVRLRPCLFLLILCHPLISHHHLSHLPHLQHLNSLHQVLHLPHHLHHFHLDQDNYLQWRHLHLRRRLHLPNLFHLKDLPFLLAHLLLLLLPPSHPSQVNHPCLIQSNHLHCHRHLLHLQPLVLKVHLSLHQPTRFPLHIAKHL